MKKLFVLIFVAAVACVSAYGQGTGDAAQRRKDSLIFVNADWQWKELEKGAAAGYASLPIFNSTQSISIVRYRASKFRTSIVSAPMEKASTTDSLAMQNGALAAINGSYFNVKTLEHATFLCIKGKKLGYTYPSEMRRCDGVLMIKKGLSRKIAVVPFNPLDEDYYARSSKAAMVSGPILLVNGQKRTEFDMTYSFMSRRHPRTFMGITKDGWIYFVVVDGRFPGQGEGATIPELVTIASWLGLHDAINLDGGGSSTIWTSATGVINHPYDNHKFDHEGLRVVPNIVVVNSLQ